MVINSLDSQTHAWTAREGNKPVLQLGRIEPALWNKLIRLREDGGVIVNERAAARNIGL
jgi:hypothetical protein